MKSQIHSGPSRKHITKWTIQRKGGPVYLTIRDNERVLVLEDSLQRCLAFRSWLPPTAKIVHKASAAIEALKAQTFDICFVDRDLGAGNGYGDDVCKFLIEVKFQGRVFIHSWNTPVAEAMRAMLAEAGIQVECVPFGHFGILRSKS